MRQGAEQTQPASHAEVRAQCVASPPFSFLSVIAASSLDSGHGDVRLLWLCRRQPHQRAEAEAKRGRGKDLLPLPRPALGACDRWLWRRTATVPQTAPQCLREEPADAR